VRLLQGLLAFHRHRLRALLRCLLAGQEVQRLKLVEDLGLRLGLVQAVRPQQVVHRDLAGREVRLPEEAKALVLRLVLVPVVRQRQVVRQPQVGRKSLGSQDRLLLRGLLLSHL